MHAQVNQGVFSDEAINGFDPVAYFMEKEAIPGKKTISYQWNNATWYFKSDEYRKRFVLNPKDYCPQYGGYCSFAVSKGFTANSDPTVFTVLNGKNYLFADKEVKQDWLSTLDESLLKSDKNWKQ